MIKSITLKIEMDNVTQVLELVGITRFEINQGMLRLDTKLNEAVALCTGEYDISIKGIKGKAL